MARTACRVVGLVAWLVGASASGQSGYAQIAPPGGVVAPTVGPPVAGSTWVAPSVGSTYSQPGLTYAQPTTPAWPAAGDPCLTCPPAAPQFDAYSATAPAAPITPLVPLAVSAPPVGVSARAGGGALFGEDVGIDESYAYLQGFIPIFQNPGQWVTFADTRGVKYFDNTDAWGLNLAAGYRWFDAGMNRVNGGYASYDYRNDGLFDFNQVSFGGESLGRLWDLRMNGYVVVDGGRDVLSERDIFDGAELLRETTFLDAYSGFDGEIGRNLTPASPTMDLKLFVGGYGFYSDGGDTGGVRVRGEATLWNRLTFGAAFQNDSQFDSTVNAFVSILFGGPGRPAASAAPSMAYRLADPLRKNLHVVLGRNRGTTAHTDPGDGDPLEFVHFDSTAAAGGDGTFENPYNTLADANIEANVGPDADVVLLRAGSDFVGQGIVIDNDGQRLLADADGVTHTITSQFGAVDLPRAGSAGAAPIISAVPGDAVTIAANDVEVSGLAIQGPGDNAIFASGVTGLDVNRNTITAAVGDAVRLEGSVSGELRDNTISGGVAPGTDGFDIATWTGGSITGNSVTGQPFAGSGFVFDQVTGGTVTGNTSTGNADDGFRITTAFTGGDFSDNTSVDNGDDGYDISGVGGTATASDNLGIGNGSNDTFEIP